MASRLIGLVFLSLASITAAENEDKIDASVHVATIKAESSGHRVNIKEKDGVTFMDQAATGSPSSLLRREPYTKTRVPRRKHTKPVDVNEDVDDDAEEVEEPERIYTAKATRHSHTEEPKSVSEQQDDDDQDDNDDDDAGIELVKSTQADKGESESEADSESESESESGADTATARGGADSESESESEAESDTAQKETAADTGESEALSETESETEGETESQASSSLLDTEAKKTEAKKTKKEKKKRVGGVEWTACGTGESTQCTCAQYRRRIVIRFQRQGRAGGQDDTVSGFPAIEASSAENWYYRSRQHGDRTYTGTPAHEMNKGFIGSLQDHEFNVANLLPCGGDKAHSKDCMQHPQPCSFEEEVESCDPSDPHCRTDMNTYDAKPNQYCCSSEYKYCSFKCFDNTTVFHCGEALDMNFPGGMDPVGPHVVKKCYMAQYPHGSNPEIASDLMVTGNNKQDVIEESYHGTNAGDIATEAMGITEKVDTNAMGNATNGGSSYGSDDDDDDDSDDDDGGDGDGSDANATSDGNSSLS